MKYLIVALEPPLDSEKAWAQVRLHCTRVYGHYAPHAWFVEYDGTVKDLTDLLWPDEDTAKHGFEAGFVVSVKRGGGTGFAAKSLWDWLRYGA